MGSCIGRTADQQPPRHQLAASSPASQSKTLPLKEEVVKWKSEVPITMGQLHSKRDEFWETAPVFEGRKEIWDAIRASAQAAELSDFSLAQAILDGANIYIPHGTLSEAYDELGNEYKVPVYCLSRPLNILCEDLPDLDLKDDVSCEETTEGVSGPDVRVLKLRLSSGKDIEITTRLTDTISSCKLKLAAKTSQPPRQRWFYGGRLLEDRLKVKDLGIPDSHVIQVVFNELFTTS